MKVRGFSYMRHGKRVHVKGYTKKGHRARRHKR
jgi:hypothetical protein